MSEPENTQEYEDLQVFLYEYFIMSTSDMKASKAQFFNGLYQNIHTIVRAELAAASPSKETNSEDSLRELHLKIHQLFEGVAMNLKDPQEACDAATQAIEALFNSKLSYGAKKRQKYNDHLTELKTELEELENGIA